MRVKTLIAFLLFTPVCYAQPIQTPEKNAYIEIMGREADKVSICKDDLPQVKFSKWDGEVSLTIKSKNTGFKKPIFSDNKVKISNNKQELNFYRFDEETFKMEILVADKSKCNNVFQFELEGWEDFNFYYQGELTQAEIDEGCKRPNDVIGSYAVYHKTKRNHRAGSTNYKTGKFCHIYRPKWIDAEGNTAWGILEIKDGQYTNTCPKEFWDKAVEPLYCNDTFGASEQGGTQTTSENYVDGSTYTLSEAGTGVSLHGWFQDESAGAHTVRMHLYDDENTLTTDGEAGE